MVRKAREDLPDHDTTRKRPEYWLACAVIGQAVSDLDPRDIPSGGASRDILIREARAFFTEDGDWGAIRHHWLSICGLDERAVYEALKDRLGGRILKPYNPKQPRRSKIPLPTKMKPPPRGSRHYIRNRQTEVPPRTPPEQLSATVQKTLSLLPIGGTFRLRDLAKWRPDVAKETLSNHLARLQVAGWVVAVAFGTYCHIDNPRARFHLAEQDAA